MCFTLMWEKNCLHLMLCGYLSDQQWMNKLLASAVISSDDCLRNLFSRRLNEWILEELANVGRILGRNRVPMKRYDGKRRFLISFRLFCKIGFCVHEETSVDEYY